MAYADHFAQGALQHPTGIGSLVDAYGTTGDGALFRILSPSFSLFKPANSPGAHSDAVLSHTHLPTSSYLGTAASSNAGAFTPANTPAWVPYNTACTTGSTANAPATDALPPTQVALRPVQYAALAGTQAAALESAFSCGGVMRFRRPSGAASVSAPASTYYISTQPDAAGDAWAVAAAAVPPCDDTANVRTTGLKTKAEGGVPRAVGAARAAGDAWWEVDAWTVRAHPSLPAPYLQFVNDAASQGGVAVLARSSYNGSASATPTLTLQREEDVASDPFLSGFWVTPVCSTDTLCASSAIPASGCVFYRQPRVAAPPSQPVVAPGTLAAGDLTTLYVTLGVCLGVMFLFLSWARAGHKVRNVATKKVHSERVRVAKRNAAVRRDFGIDINVIGADVDLAAFQATTAHRPIPRA